MTTRADFVASFTARGHQLWVVGGAIRDEIMGRPARGDEDFATSARPDEIQSIAEGLGAPVNLVGQRFGTVGVQLDHRWSEITTFRGDSYAGGTRWPDVTFGASIEEDLARRDFTVNAIARNAVTGHEIDLYGGRADIERQLIRAVGVPARRFEEDPLRILRGLRFVSQLDFEIDAETLAGMTATAPLLATLSQERVTHELDLLLQGASPARALELVRTTGALDVILPELSPMYGCEQNRFHQFDVWGHTLSAVQDITFDDDDDRRIRRWTAFFHDLGKPAVRHRKANGEWGFYRHEVVGGDMAETLLDRLKFGRKDARLVVLLIRRHMDRPDPATNRQVRRFMSKVEGHWRDLVALKRADNTSHTYNDDAYHDSLFAACERVEADEAAELRAESPLTGEELMSIFDREPGPWIRRVKERLSSMVLAGELAPGDRDGAEEIARRTLAREATGRPPRQH